MRDDGVITRFSKRGRVLCCEDGAYRRGPRWRGTQAGEKEIHLKPAWPFVSAVLFSLALFRFTSSTSKGDFQTRVAPIPSFSGPIAPG